MLLRRLEMSKFAQQQEVVADLERAANDQRRGRPGQSKQRAGKSRDSLKRRGCAERR